MHFPMIYTFAKAKMYKILYILWRIYIFVLFAQKPLSIFVHILLLKYLIMNLLLRIMYIAKGQK